jgi:hypothetical protein
MFMFAQILETGVGKEVVDVPGPPAHSAPSPMHPSPTKQKSGTKISNCSPPIPVPEHFNEDTIGWGITPCPNLAVHYMARAACGGHVNAAFKLSEYIRDGFGCVANIDLSNKWKIYATELQSQASRVLEQRHNSYEICRTPQSVEDAVDALQGLSLSDANSHVQ